MYTTGDFLIRIKNAYMACKPEVILPFSKENLSIGKILEKEGYIAKIEERKDEKKSLIATLSYTDRTPALSQIRLVSKPSVHHYVTRRRIPKTRGGFGITILTTSKGIMTDKKARKEGVGGEVICEVY